MSAPATNSTTLSGPVSTEPSRANGIQATGSTPDRIDSLGLWKSFSFRAAHAAASALLWIVGVGGLYRIGQAIGIAEWCINYKRRRRYVAALAKVLDHSPTAQERRWHCLEYFVRTRCDKLFYLVFDRVPRERALALLTIGNRELLDRALARGHGAYVALSHHGPHHVTGMLVALHGYKAAGVRDRNEGGLRRFVQSRFDQLYPEFGRTRFLFADSFPREIFRCLEEGYVLGSAIDVHRVRHPNQKTVTVRIFGEERDFVSGPMYIALRCKTPVLQGILHAEHGFRYRLELAEMLIDPETVTDEDAAVEQAMHRYAANVEHHIRSFPTLITRI